MPVPSDITTRRAIEHPLPNERDVEVEVLMQAFTALRRDGILTDAEYEAKRRRLAARR